MPGIVRTAWKLLSARRVGLAALVTLALAACLPGRAGLALAQAADSTADSTAAVTAHGASSETPEAGRAGVPVPANTAPAGVTPAASASRPAAAEAPTAGHAVPAAAPDAAGASALSAPATLRHVQEWLAYRAARHLASLPLEARIFYRRGLIARQAGQSSDAFINVRGAAELDPQFVEPHLTLASWTLARDPSQALLHYAIVVELLRQNFNLQLNLVANSLILALQALFTGLLLAALIVVVLRRDELTHGWRERLQAFTSETGARWWTLGAVAIVYLSGFGITLPTLAFLGHLWPVLRIRERILFVLLLTATATLPLTLRVVERLSLPMHEEAAPLYGVPTLENASYVAARQAQLSAVAAHDGRNPLVQFGLGWVARRGNDLATSERAYRAALSRWPGDDRTLNNLGNVLAIVGRDDEALDCYARATRANPANAAAWYNASQIHTKRFEYDAATDALSKASALNFELVKGYQSLSTADGLLPLVDQWLSPRVFWDSLLNAPLPPSLAGSIPVGLRDAMETRGWGFTALALLFAILGLAFGVREHQSLPQRVCGNCGRVVCRRCAERRRELALCPRCVRTEADAETPDFSRLLLMRERQRRHRNQHLVHTTIAAILPGFGLLAHRRVFTSVFLIAASWLLLREWADLPPPFAIEPRLAMPGQDVPLVLILGCFAIVYAISLLLFFRLAAREREREAALHAIAHGRVTQASRRATPMAA